MEVAAAPVAGLVADRLQMVMMNTSAVLVPCKQGSSSGPWGALCQTAGAVALGMHMGSGQNTRRDPLSRSRYCSGAIQGGTEE